MKPNASPLSASRASNSASPIGVLSFFVDNLWLSAQLWSMNPFPLVPESVVAYVSNDARSIPRVRDRMIKLGLWLLSSRTESPFVDAKIDDSGGCYPMHQEAY